MDHGSSDRVPISLLILLASAVFTLITFATFKFLWQIHIPIYMLVTVLGLQLASLFLGSSKILTQLGAASLSTLIGVSAAIVSVFLLFPPSMELRVAGITGTFSALVFIVASFVAASRQDPLPTASPEPLIFNDPDTGHTAVLIKYGEMKAAEPAEEYDLLLTEDSWHKNPSVEQTTADPDETDPFSEEPAEQDPPGEFEISGKWVEETARVMAYDTPLEPAAGRRSKDGVDVKDDGKNQDAGGAPGFNLRTRFKVLDGSSGEHYGTCYGDEGYSTLDPDSLTRLIGSDLAAGELRIVKLDWSNFDEIEVHVQMEEVLHVELEDDVEEAAGETDILNDYSDGEIEAGPGDPSSEGTLDKEVSSAKIPSGIRYIIYDRRTIQPMGEYVPEGGRSRIDRLTLYKMFPEYDFRTFEIDSIRWEADEVRIFIRGEKKNPKARIQSQKEDLKNGKM